MAETLKICYRTTQLSWVTVIFFEQKYVSRGYLLFFIRKVITINPFLTFLCYTNRDVPKGGRPAAKIALHNQNFVSAWFSHVADCGWTKVTIEIWRTCALNDSCCSCALIFFAFETSNISLLLRSNERQNQTPWAKFNEFRVEIFWGCISTTNCATISLSIQSTAPRCVIEKSDLMCCLKNNSLWTTGHCLEALFKSANEFLHHCVLLFYLFTVLKIRKNTSILCCEHDFIFAMKMKFLNVSKYLVSFK